MSVLTEAGERRQRHLDAGGKAVALLYAALAIALFWMATQVGDESDRYVAAGTFSGIAAVGIWGRTLKEPSSGKWASLARLVLGGGAVIFGFSGPTGVRTAIGLAVVAVLTEVVALWADRRELAQPGPAPTVAESTSSSPVPAHELRP